MRLARRQSLVGAFLCALVAPQLALGQEPPPPPPPPAAPPAAPAPKTGEPVAPTGTPGVAPEGSSPTIIEGHSADTTIAPPSAEPQPPSVPAAEPLPPSAATAVPAPSHEKAEPKGPEFIKGELIYPGTRRLLSRYDHIGVAAGPYIIGNDFYLSVTPGMAYYGKTVSVSLGVPLNLLAVQGGSFNFGGMKVRREDWNEIPNYPRVIRFFTIGRKEDNLYFSINSLRPATIGYGELVKQYQGNIDVDRSMTGMMFDAYNKYAGFQFQANDITTVNRVIGGLVFLKPLSFFSDDILAESLSIGGEYVGDFAAPQCVRTRLNKDNVAECVQGTGNAAGFDPYTGENLDRTFARSNPDTGRFDVTKTTVHAAGFSGEFKIYKDERNIDLKVFGTWDKFLNSGGGDGLSAGLLARLNAGTSYINAFRIQTELRSFTDGFRPGYFDSLYEIQKYSYAVQNNPYQVTPTKYQAIFGDPENGFARPNDGRRTGYNLEASWGVFKGGRRGKQIALGFGLSDSTGPNDTQFYGHLELPLLGFLQLFGTYMKTADTSVGNLFKGSPFTAENAVVLTGARLEILPILFINAHYSRGYRVVRSPGQEYHLGNNNVVGGNGQPSPFFPEARLFENVQTLFVELEFGWEFSNDDQTRPEEEGK